MKKTICTMIVLLAFQTGMLFAGGIKHHTLKPETGKTETNIDLEKLSPAPPSVAEFTDGTEYGAAPDAMISELAPSTPKEADFEDPDQFASIDIQHLAPLTPAEPDFEEFDFASCPALPALAPDPPAEAGFME